MPRDRSAVVVSSRAPVDKTPALPRSRWRGFRFGRSFMPLLIVAIMLVVAYDLYLVGIGIQ